jgi:hypothetical protein
LSIWLLLVVLVAEGLTEVVVEQADFVPERVYR